MPARIYRPARTATQSGWARTDEWVLEFEPEQPRRIEPLMGYTASADTRAQVRMTFPTAEAAAAYCERNGLAYTLFRPREPRRRRAAYADNFSYARKQPWTH
ncbi:MAG: NADH-ubiquinone oxidoreductase [Alphaproteobacteria bacterium]|nr:MAG: NADH-ubiquinone oxidoreductase [Alphaproteobacteria bacterium]